MTGGFKILALGPVKNISDKGSGSIVVIQKENGSGSWARMVNQPKRTSKSYGLF